MYTHDILSENLAKSDTYEINSYLKQVNRHAIYVTWL